MGQSTKKENRITSLDAMRGLAALWVLLTHQFNAIDGFYKAGDWWLRFTPLRFLTDARFPVVLFFVLSGFVLSAHILNDPRFSYANYATRRVFRIYLPFAASMLCAWLLLQFIGAPAVPGVSPWVNTDWLGSVSFEALARQLAMIGRHEDTNLNFVVWSLVVEMRICLLLPLLAFAAVRFRLAVPAMALVSIGAWLLALSLGEKTPFYTGATFTTSMVISAYFIFPFAVGIWLSQNMDRIGPIKNGWRLVPLLVVAYLVIHRVTSGLVQDFAYAFLTAAAMVLAVKSPALTKAMGIGILQWLGRISYSLYLFHIVILNALLKGLHEVVPIGWLVLASIPISFICAEIANRLIEARAASWGRVVANYFFPPREQPMANEPVQGDPLQAG